MKIFCPIVCILFLLFGCANGVTPAPRGASAPTPKIELPTLLPVAPTLLNSDLSKPVVTAAAVESPTATRRVVTATPTIFPTPFAGTLTLAPRASFSVNCDFDFAKLPSQGFEQLSYLPTGDCSNGELALFQIGSSTYIAQSGLFGAAFTITDVTNSSAPQIIGIWDLPPESYTLDLKTFRQGEKFYLALGLQRNRQQPELVCGIVIVEVTNVRQPKLVTRLDGRNVGAPEPWCNVHTLEIDADASGNATYLIVSDVDTFSARAVDIRDLENPRETNSYHLHAHPHTAPNQPVLNYVHDSYVAADKIYLANWLAGVVILDKQKFEAGAVQDAVIIKPTENVAPGGFHAHYVVPIANGEFIFIQDELNADNGLRLLDIRDPKNPKTLWTETNQGGVNAPHNFVIRDDLSQVITQNGNRVPECVMTCELFVGWYNDGVKVFRFDVRDPNNVTVKPIAFQEVRANKNITRERYFDGVWGVRVNECVVKNVKRICVYASDMSAGLLVLALE